MLPVFINILLTIHVIVSLLIVLAVLMQRPKNEGLGAAFGGGMTDNLFGAQTTNVLQTFTRWLGGLFFGLTLLLSFLYVRQTGSPTGAGQQLRARTDIPAAPPAPAPGTVAPPTLLKTDPEVATGSVKPGDVPPTPGAPPQPVDATTPGPMPVPTPAEPSAPAATPNPPTEAAKSAPMQPVTPGTAPAVPPRPTPAPGTPPTDSNAPAPATPDAAPAPPAEAPTTPPSPAPAPEKAADSAPPAPPAQ